MKANVVEVNEATFNKEVLEKSKEVPVVVDFWAPWCGPCRMLTPVLETLAAEGEGRWILAKVNSDENPALAARYGVRGIPNVKAFRDGRLVDEFVGAQPRPIVERFLDKLVPSEWDRMVAEAEKRIAAGKPEEARAQLAKVLENVPSHEAAHLAMARVEAGDGNTTEALRHLDAIPAKGPYGAVAEHLRARIRLTGATEHSQQDLARQIQEDPDNLQARFDLARLAVQSGEYDTAAEQLLAILERQRDFRNGEARQALLDLFVVMGEEDPRTRKYRQKLSWLLFA